MRRIVVFGASGDVGRYFIDYLLTQKAEYQIIAVGHRKSFSIFKDCPSVQYYPIDITQKSEFNHLPKDIFAVVDFAGLMPARMKGYYPQRYIDVNITDNCKCKLNSCFNQEHLSIAWTSSRKWSKSSAGV